ncbi:hypothetical protein Q2T40_05095 [Winogradskyella maritima]|nr:hypothetical protein [Winogradskyella maritima]
MKSPLVTETIHTVALQSYFTTFGEGHTVQLNGRPTTNFQRGDTLKWDFNTNRAIWKNSTDAWDELMLETEVEMASN